MTGTEFLVRIRQLYPDAVRIVLSGYSEIDSITSAVNEGDVYRYLLKPWNDEELKKHISDAFSTYNEQTKQNLFGDSINQLIQDYDDTLASCPPSGIKQLDDFHDAIINSCKDICQEFNQSRASDVTALRIEQIAEQLTLLAKKNFQIEEQLMSRFNYPATDMHIAEHELFISQIKLLKSSTNTSNPNRLVFLMFYVSIWIKHHENGSDKYLIDFLNQQDDYNTADNPQTL